MIDAYEIGIQLLLQEDVSAGLEVINRGLAEVDRAIAATSADLAGLAKEAESATKAVAAAVSARATPAAATSQTPGSPVEQVVQGKPLEAPATASSMPARTTAAAPDVKSAEPTVSAATSSPSLSKDETMLPAAASSPSAPRDELLLPKPDARDQNVSSSAPVNSGAAQHSVTDQREQAMQAETEPPVSVAPAQVVVAAPRQTEPLSQLANQDAAAARDPRVSAASPRGQMALTASVSRAQRSEMPAVKPDVVRRKPPVEQSARLERPAAPWSGVAEPGTQAQATRLHEKASAPKSANQDRSGSGGGTVMLDGRLVGQWLSEHMAREASRPPAGTSFFDPRQTPAWNVSGAL